MRDQHTPVSVDRALRDDGVSVEVPDGENLAIGLFSESYPDAFRIASVVAFEELQDLALVPQGISESDAVDAVTADDLLYRDAVRQMSLTADESACRECRTSRGLVRRMFQQNLSDALQLSPRRSALRDDPDLLAAHFSIQRWIDRPVDYLVGVARPADIAIGAGSTLFMAPTVQVMKTGVIEISASGVLRFEASAVTARCDELRGVPDPHVSIDPLEVEVYVPPDWKSIGGLLNPPDPLEFGAGTLGARLGRHLSGIHQEVGLARAQILSA